MQASILWRHGLAIALVAGGVVSLGACGRTAVPADARPVVDRFVAAVGSGSLEDVYACADADFRSDAPAASLAPVLTAMNAVLGRRVSTGEPTVTRSLESGARLAIEVPSSHERGSAVLGLETVRGPDGRWTVSRCAARSAAFEWVLR